ncbi:siphovirus Gp157 family protein [Acidicapsa dinghuensis]|uniref:Siphovirus Gp157 family protein n=1 Tax=Acidicapsa dinghuensis TaxID=2218256 RepID=A0ABW1EGH5_9BACT|nr:siphovirus Gp157 family protein [Acidicapsa dinghuensis]
MSSIASSISLFEIDEELDTVVEEIQEEISSKGEASAALVERFEEFCKAHGEKVDRIGRFVRSMEARTQHCRAEAQRLSERARSAENKTLRTKSMVLYFLKVRNLRRIEGQEFTLRIQANSQDSVVIHDEQQIPIEYKNVGIAINGKVWNAIVEAVPGELKHALRSAVQESTPDNNAIRLAASRNEVVPGAEVKRGEHLRVA